MAKHLEHLDHYLEITQHYVSSNKLANNGLRLFWSSYWVILIFVIEQLLEFELFRSKRSQYALNSCLVSLLELKILKLEPSLLWLLLISPKGSWLVSSWRRDPDSLTLDLEQSQSVWPKPRKNPKYTYTVKNHLVELLVNNNLNFFYRLLMENYANILV